MSYKLIMGDCLEKMADIEPGSVDAVICDPPYGIVKGVGESDGIDHGMAGRTGWDDALEPAEIFTECNRIMRPNGAILLFSQEPYTSKLICQAHGSIPFSYRMTWIKDHFANGLLAKKAPVSYTEDILAFFKNFDSFLGHPLKPWLDRELEAAGMTRREALESWGSTASHYFTDGRQFCIPSSEKLSKMQADTGRFQIDYADMKSISDDFRAQTRKRFPKVFNLPEGQKYKSNVLQYKKDYTGHHPTQKPVALMEDLVKTYTNPGDTVLDFTMGSGSTGVACVNTGRKFIGIERDPGYFQIAKQRLEEASK